MRILFPELRSLLTESFEAAEPGTNRVITVAESATKNFRTRMQKIIARAGVEAWPKRFQNLRSSRQTELENSYPTHVVCSWLGNSTSVAQKHYLQVTDDHFAAAGTPPAPGPTVETQANAAPIPSQGVAQKAAQYSSAYTMHRLARPKNRKSRKPLEFKDLRLFAGSCNRCQNRHNGR